MSRDEQLWLMLLGGMGLILFSLMMPLLLVVIGFGICAMSAYQLFFASRITTHKRRKH